MLYQQGYNMDFFDNKYLQGAYVADVHMPEVDNKLLLVYKYEPETEFEVFEEKIIEHPEFVASYDYEAFDTLVYVFNIPDRFKEDYNLISAFKYNSISSELKLFIVKFWSVEPEDELFKIITGTKEYEGESFDKQIFNIEEDDFDDLHEQIRKALEAQEAVEGLSL